MNIDQCFKIEGGYQVPNMVDKNNKIMTLKEYSKATNLNKKIYWIASPDEIKANKGAKKRLFGAYAVTNYIKRNDWYHIVLGRVNAPKIKELNLDLVLAWHPKEEHWIIQGCWEIIGLIDKERTLLYTSDTEGA